MEPVIDYHRCPASELWMPGGVVAKSLPPSSADSQAVDNTEILSTTTTHPSGLRSKAFSLANASASDSHSTANQATEIVAQFYTRPELFSRWQARWLVRSPSNGAEANSRRPSAMRVAEFDLRGGESSLTTAVKENPVFKATDDNQGLYIHGQYRLVGEDTEMPPSNAMISFVGTGWIDKDQERTGAWASSGSPIITQPESDDAPRTLTFIGDRPIIDPTLVHRMPHLTLGQPAGGPTISQGISTLVAFVGRSSSSCSRGNA